MACAAGGVSGAAHAATNPDAGSVPQRPTIDFYRWQEDWSVLADPRVPREPGDALKYIRLSDADPSRYVSLGVTVRERYVDTDPPVFGTEGGQRERFLLHRLELHADAHLTDHTRVFLQLENALAPGLPEPSPVDANRLDLRLLFVDYQVPAAGGLFKLRAGRQEIAFDLQRFVSVRNGPNVRQAYDAVWAAFERGAWRFTGFISQPVQYRNRANFDDFSDRHLTFGGVRAQRQFGDANELSVSLSDFREDDAHALAGTATDHRQSVDIHDTGRACGFDWDIEAMRQWGRFGAMDVDAWAFGSLLGFTFQGHPWTPRVGIQFDAASGDRDPADGRVGTFNPLFPNGAYLNLAGYTGYTNFLHLKPSFSVAPVDDMKLTAAVGLLWRQTTHDAIYTMPAVPVPGTAGRPGRRSGTYGQLQWSWTVTRSLTFAAEFDRYLVAPALRRAGGKDSSYLGVEASWGW